VDQCKDFKFGTQIGRH